MVSTAIILFCTCAAFVAGFIDSIAGGGGLITIPALLLSGLPPQLALGTNKMGCCLGTGVAMLNFARSNLILWRLALLGVGLAMDAFSVSMANGLHDPRMSRGTMCRIAGTFALFQAVMPMTGWVCVHTIVELFSSFETFIPWIALALLGYIGGKMLVDGIKGEEAEEATELSAGALFMQGVATSIDALSVGFTISEYGWLMALAASIIIAVVTFFLCMAGLNIGKKFGTELSGKASILGGVILIGIGLEIFISGVFCA